MTVAGKHNCYVDGFPCGCGAFDVLHDGCPRDEYAHEEDQDYSDVDIEGEIEALIDAEYGATIGNGHDDETSRL